MTMRAKIVKTRDDMTMYENGQVVAEWTEIDGATGETIYCEKVYQFGKFWTFRERFGNVPLSVCLKKAAATLGGEN